MKTHHWEAMGTVWHISLDTSVDSAELSPLWVQLEKITADFEAQFSRFLPDSEVNTWAHHLGQGQGEVSPVLGELLRFAQKLKKLTAGAFDPMVGGLLERAGYDAEYSFQAKDTQHWQAPNWSVDEQNMLQFSEGMVIDIGGFGKGFWIDTISNFLHEAGFPFHLVDGGGDMYGTQKADGSAWRVAIENSEKIEEALDVIPLRFQALAVSDTIKRKWGEWHHVVNPLTKQPAQRLRSVAVVAKSALVADALTTCLMVSEPLYWLDLAKNYPHASLICPQSGEVIISPNW